ncbi:hypothetical protein B7P43_G05988 [Cryptotermes secundus]|uniref:Uncharacterized protein n=1 Tax=Cryptotermes secundus TaxID=105785 RepID=A0A2J7RDT4_9NEOP|nr:hypothetical protein B7P43_G05988 [Cryptotermes secundus]
MLTSSVVVLHGNVCPHTAAPTLALLEHSTGSCLTTLTALIFALNNYHLLSYLKNWLGLQIFNNGNELMEGVKTWLCSQEADFFDTSI